MAGIDILRKICNHPDLLQRKQWESMDKYGDPVRSGKLTVAMKVLLHLICPSLSCQQLSKEQESGCSSMLTGAVKATPSDCVQGLATSEVCHSCA